jgi:DNA polymerase-3 subunit beta
MAVAACTASGGLATTTAPAAKLSELVSRLPGDADLDLTIDGDQLIIAAGRSCYKLATLPASDFPPSLQPGAEVATVTLTKDQLRRLFEIPAHAACTEPTRFYLCGTYLYQKDGRIVAVATDGHRLAEVRSTLEFDADWSGVIIPQATCEQILRAGRNRAVTLAFDNETIIAHCGKVIIASKLIDGAYPDYRHVVPDGSDNVVEVERKMLIAAVKRLAVLADKDSKRVPAAGLSWAPGDGALTLSLSGEPGRALDLIPATVSGTGHAIVAVRFLLDTLEALPAAAVRLETNGANTPIRVTAGDDPDVLLLVMPRQW